MTTRKTIALTRWTFLGKVMSLLFNMLPRIVINFLPRSKHLSLSWQQSPSSVILEPQNQGLSLFPLFPSILAMKWWDQMPWSSFSECWVWLRSQIFHSPLSLSSRGSSSLSAIRVVSLPIWVYWYFSQQSWFLLALHPTRHFALCTLHIS